MSSKKGGTNPPQNQVKLNLQRLKEFVVKFSPRRGGI